MPLTRTRSLLFSLWLSACIFATAQAQKTYFDKDWKETQKAGAAYYRTTKPHDGLFEVKDFYIGGKPQFTGISKSKTDPLVLHGKCTWYAENGHKTQEGTFSDNLPHGLLTTYYPDGAKKSEAAYTLGKTDGVSREFFPSGKMQSEAHYKNGTPDGRYVKYFTESQKKEEVYFTDGLVNGAYEFYNSNGQLFNKGNALNGAQEGTCYDYYYEGGLRKIYTVHDRLLDGFFYEFTPSGDTAAVGFFEQGKPVRFRAQSLRITNGSRFSTEMELRDGTEHWKIFRDGRTVMQHQYREGNKTGLWTLYTYDGAKLFETIDYTGAGCSEKYLQQTREKFDPFFFLGDRFCLDADLIKDKKCSPVINRLYEKDATLSPDDHPFYHHKKETADMEAGEGDRKVKGRVAPARDIDYKEPALQPVFLNQNNCIENFDKKYPGVTRCRRESDGTTYVLYTSADRNLLLKLKATLKPGPAEIFFFYQRFEQRKYTAEEPRPVRYMAFSLPVNIAEAFREKIMDDIIPVSVLEHGFFKGYAFSGMAAAKALNEALGK